MNQAGGSLKTGGTEWSFSQPETAVSIRDTTTTIITVTAVTITTNATDTTTTIATIAVTITTPNNIGLSGTTKLRMDQTHKNQHEPEPQMED